MIKVNDIVTSNGTDYGKVVEIKKMRNQSYKWIAVAIVEYKFPASDNPNYTVKERIEVSKLTRQ